MGMCAADLREYQSIRFGTRLQRTWMAESCQSRCSFLNRIFRIFSWKKSYRFGLKYLKVGKKSYRLWATFALNTLKSRKKSYFLFGIARVLNTLKQKKNPILFPGKKFGRGRGSCPKNARKIDRKFAIFLNAF